MGVALAKAPGAAMHQTSAIMKANRRP